MSELILVEPSKELETSAMQYRNDFIEHGETHINGSCGLFHYSNYDEWLERVTLAHNRDTSFIHVPVIAGMVCVQRSAVKGMERSNYLWYWKKPGNYTFPEL